MSAAGADVSAAGADGLWLDQLPLELVLEIASHLDLRSILRLERVSSRYRDAKPPLRQQVRVLQVGKLGCDSISSAELLKLELLPQLLRLRELHVRVSFGSESARILLEALVAASRHWKKLETLRVIDKSGKKLETLRVIDKSDSHRPSINQLLVRLCINSPRLTDVRLSCNISDKHLERLVAALPAIRTFRVNAYRRSLSGSFLSRLPAELRHLSVGCKELHSVAVTELRRYGELRTLELRCVQPAHLAAVQPAHLAAGLSGCGRLRSLTVDSSALTSECLLHLPELRHLGLSSSWLNGADLDRLLSALPPGLESLSLRNCCGLTPEGLAMCMTTLSSLPKLRSLDLTWIDAVCDLALAELRSESLQQLYLDQLYLDLGEEQGVLYTREPELTATGLLAVIKNSGSLKTLKWSGNGRMGLIDCNPAARQQGLLKRIQAITGLQVQKSRATSPSSQTQYAHKRQETSD